MRITEITQLFLLAVSTAGVYPFYNYCSTEKQEKDLINVITNMQYPPATKIYFNLIPEFHLITQVYLITFVNSIDSKIFPNMVPKLTAALAK